MGNETFYGDGFRPTDPKSENAFDNKQNKRGDGLKIFNFAKRKSMHLPLVEGLHYS